MVKNAFNFLILRSIERKYYYYLSVGICKFLFLFVETCSGYWFECPINIWVGLWKSSCQDCIRRVIFDTCLAEEICSRGLIETIKEFFYEKFKALGWFGDLLVSLFEEIIKQFIGDCK